MSSLLRNAITCVKRVFIKGVLVEASNMASTYIETQRIMESSKVQNQENAETLISPSNDENIAKLKEIKSSLEANLKDKMDTAKNLETRGQWVGTYIGIILTVFLGLSDSSSFVLKSYMDLLMLALISFFAIVSLLSICMVIKTQIMSEAYNQYSKGEADHIYESISEYDLKKILSDDIKRLARGGDDLKNWIDKKARFYKYAQIATTTAVILIFLFFLMGVKNE